MKKKLKQYIWCITILQLLQSKGFRFIIWLKNALTMHSVERANHIFPRKLGFFLIIINVLLSKLGLALMHFSVLIVIIYKNRTPLFVIISKLVFTLSSHFSFSGFFTCTTRFLPEAGYSFTALIRTHINQ